MRPSNFKCAQSCVSTGDWDGDRIGVATQNWKFKCLKLMRLSTGGWVERHDLQSLIVAFALLKLLTLCRTHLRLFMSHLIYQIAPFMLLINGLFSLIAHPYSQKSLKPAIHEAIKWATSDKKPSRPTEVAHHHTRSDIADTFPPATKSADSNFESVVAIYPYTTHSD